MIMKDKAVKAMIDEPTRRAWSLADLRRKTGISMRSQYRLANQLLDDERVEHLGGNVFRVIAQSIEGKPAA